MVQIAHFDEMLPLCITIDELSVIITFRDRGCLYQRMAQLGGCGEGDGNKQLEVNRSESK